MQLYSMASLNKNAEMLEYLDKMEQAMINPREHVSSGNKDIDGILNFMLEKAVSILKKVDVQVKIPEDLHTCSFELAVILGNIIDNAIEAASKVDIEEREIKLLAKMSGNNLYLEMDNPYTGNLRKQGRNYLTTKGDKNEHGLGLRIVENIINRHSGQMIIDDKENYFRIKVLLYNIGK